MTSYPDFGYNGIVFIWAGEVSIIFTTVTTLIIQKK